MLGSILEILGGLLHFDFSVLTENIITLVLTLFGAVLGFFSIYYLGRRRKTLDHERLAAIVKGMHRAGISRDAFRKAPASSHDHLLTGLRWLFTGMGVSAALYTYGSIEPVVDAGESVRGALIGVVPGAIGIAHLLCAFVCRRKERNQDPFPSRMAYRAVSRRY